MKVEFKLKDNRFCGSCPCFHVQDEFEFVWCTMKMFKQRKGYRNAILEVAKNKLHRWKNRNEEEKLLLSLYPPIELVNIRPQKCIDKYGE